jgi:hypothetical protein
VEDRTIRNEIFIFNKITKILDLNNISIQKSYMRRICVVILIIIIIPINKEEVYAEAELYNFQKQENNINEKSSNDTVKTKISDFFTVDNKTYKILDKDKTFNEVMLWLCNESSDSNNIVVENQVNYNGNIFDIKYICDNAFSKSCNAKSITIGNKILGFCDSDGNKIEELDKLFYNNKKLENVDLGNIECILGDNYFASCNIMTNVKMSENIQDMRSHCFDRCDFLEEIDLSKIKKISGVSCFGQCIRLKDIGELNDELMELPPSTFINCNTLKINSLKNIKKLGYECFKSCKMLSQDIVSDVEEIGKNCFENCNFKEVYLKRAKKIEDNAFGGIYSLTKIRFGNNQIPILGINIVNGSDVNEWIYPKEYINQPGYLEFLSKLNVSKVIWNYNYGNYNSEVMQGDKLNSLNPPKINRAGYEIEGWYKESDCINKVNMLADLGKVIDSDLVIKKPELYAKWRETKEKKPSEPEKPKPEEEPIKPSEPEKPKPEEEPTKPSEPEKPKPEEKPTKPSEPEKPKPEEEPIIPSEPEKPKPEEEPTKPSEPEKPKPEEKPTKPSGPEKPKPEEEPIKPSKPQKQKKKSKAKKRISLYKRNDETKVDESDKFSIELNNRLNTENYIKDLNIKINDENKYINLEKTSRLSLDYEMVKTFILPVVRNSNVELEVLTWSYTDNINNNMEITKSGVLSKIIENNNCVGIYLKNNDCFEKDSILNIKLKDNLNLSKLYSYNEELGKFILINDNLKVDNNLIEVKTTNIKQYLITKFDLNKDDIAVYGWNKIKSDWYYIQTNGVLAINTIIDGYFVGSDGKLI